MKTLLCVAVIFFLTLASAPAQSAAPTPAPDPAKTEKQDALWQKLGDVIADADRNLDGVMGVAILDLTSGQMLTHHADSVFPQASSIKIAVLAELYRQEQQAREAARSTSGKARLNDLYTVNAADLVPDSDIMGGFTPGVTKTTNRDLATMMVAVSDNSATNVLIDRVGIENVNAMLDGLGLHQTRLRRKMMDLKAASDGRENVSTPREMMLLLDILYRGKLLGPELTKDFFAVLSTHKDDYISRAMPDEVRTATKPGALEGVRNSSGIVYASHRPFVICVMTTYDSDERAAEDAIGRVGLAAYRTFDRLGRASEYGRVISPKNSGNR